MLEVLRRRETILEDTGGCLSGDTTVRALNTRIGAPAVGWAMAEVLGAKEEDRAEAETGARRTREVGEATEVMAVGTCQRRQGWRRAWELRPELGKGASAQGGALQLGWGSSREGPRLERIGPFEGKRNTCAWRRSGRGRPEPRSAADGPRGVLQERTQSEDGAGV